MIATTNTPRIEPDTDARALAALRAYDAAVVAVASMRGEVRYQDRLDAMTAALKAAGAHP